ncbi:MAG: GNAT family N-acetyltransferase [Planctomycetota bacterium]
MTAVASITRAARGPVGIDASERGAGARGGSEAGMEAGASAVGGTGLSTGYGAGHGVVIARPARVADAGTITRLVGVWSRQGFTIQRRMSDVLSNLGDFAVSTWGGERRVIACGALETVSATLGEIRSVAVEPGASGGGSGRAVVEHLVSEAEARGMNKVCLLTRVPAFFERCGFRSVASAELPVGFVGEHLSEQGRTHIGRTAMLRETG